MSKSQREPLYECHKSTLTGRITYQVWASSAEEAKQKLIDRYGITPDWVGLAHHVELAALREQVARITAERDAYLDAGYAMAGVCGMVAGGHGGNVFVADHAKAALAKFDEAHVASAKGTDR